MQGKVIEQMVFCRALSDRVYRNVKIHEKEKAKTGLVSCGYNGIAEAGASTTQIRAAIVMLRRELSTLSRMLDEMEETQ